jgi:hypothetical protein
MERKQCGVYTGQANPLDDWEVNKFYWNKLNNFMFPVVSQGGN